MIAGLNIEPLWSDVDVIKASISAFNGEFGGVAEVYIGIGGLAEAASLLEGFPRASSDVRELEFGTFSSGFAGGGVYLHFSCADGAGHAIVEVRIASESTREMGGRLNRPAQSAHFLALLEANAVDEFVADLRRSETTLTGAAFLRFEG
jgi:hypothetical protein